jgi:2-polyprenyl-3-methyl-5-hydroxy-6-metoxy-1,4-benzoquinol methylase
MALAHAQLSARQLAEGAHGPALESIASALSLAPGLAPLWIQFSDVIRYFNLRHPVPAPIRDLLAKALEHPAVDPGDLVRPVTTLALSRANPLEDPLLLRLLEDVVIRDAQLERLIINTRRRMLDGPLPLPLMTAIAHQCFNTEYVFEETEAERAQLASLREQILKAQWVSEHWCAAYAAYRPLQALRAKTFPIASLVRRQILEPEEERRLAADVPSLSGARTAVSARVQAQYEENPYPRWLRAPAPGASPHRIAGKARILVAGCGTGQHAIATAQQYPAASVLAVDLSLASLAYAKRKTLELGLTNIEYRQADILALDGMAERFDLIECSGVLHHLEDPFAGWRVLKDLLNPGAFMRVGLYSETARRGVVRARELIAAQGFAPDAAGIRACRAVIRARTGDAELAALARNEDFYSMSGCRDLLFHVQEHRFSLPQIEAMIGRLGLRFLGFEFPDSGGTLARYHQRFRDPLDLKSWHRFESEFPDTFSRMYQFWVS